MKDAQVDLTVRRHIAAQARSQLAVQRISVSEAARRLGWGQTVLQRRVMGEIGFEASELARFAALLDVPIEQFFPARNIPGKGFRTGPFPGLLLAA